MKSIKIGFLSVVLGLASLGATASEKEGENLVVSASETSQKVDISTEAVKENQIREDLDVKTKERKEHFSKKENHYKDKEYSKNGDKSQIPVEKLKEIMNKSYELTENSYKTKLEILNKEKACVNEATTNEEVFKCKKDSNTEKNKLKQEKKAKYEKKSKEHREKLEHKEHKEETRASEDSKEQFEAKD